MSCLVTMAVVTNDEDVSQLIDTINDITVFKKYLIIFMDTLNTTLLQKRAINFNVLMYHKNTGEPLIYLILLRHKQNFCCSHRRRMDCHLLLPSFGKNVCFRTSRWMSCILARASREDTEYNLHWTPPTHNFQSCWWKWSHCNKSLSQKVSFFPPIPSSKNSGSI